MLFLDGVYVERPDGSLRFRWVKAPTSAELTQLTQTLARRIGRYLEGQGWLTQDAENSYLVGDVLEAGPMEQLLGSSITYRIAIGRQQGRKVFTLQTLPACDDSFDDGVGKVAGFSLHAGVAARADQRQKLERLCRYISRPAIAEQCLSLTPNGNARYQLKTPYRDGTTHVIFEPLDWMAHIPVRHPPGDLRSSQSAILPIGHCPAGGSGAETAGQPHPFGCAPSLARPLRAHCVRPNSLPVNLSRGVRAEQQVSRAGDTGKAGQGRSAGQDRESGGAYARRTPRRDDVGTTPQASLRHRYRDLPGLRRSGANHRLYRGSGRDSDDPRSPGDKRRNLRTLPVTRKPGAAWSAVRLTPSSSFNPGCCFLEAHGRVPAGRPPEMARTRRWRGKLWRCAGDGR
jgi:hypothetical protein